MKFFKFFASRAFLINIAIAIVLLIAVYFAVVLGLDSYTNHNQAIAVPDFKGLTLEEVEKIATEKNLVVEIMDSVYTNNVEKGAIYSQLPEAEFKVKEGRIIYLTINAMLPESVQMPDLVGGSLRQAKSDIETYGLEIGNLRYVPDIATNSVLKQIYNGKEIKSGELIEIGSTIDLVLGKGLSNQKAFVPNIKGLSQDKALERLTAASLNIGAIIVDTATIKTDEDSLKAIIYKQYPVHRKDAEINLGAFIDIWITNDESLINRADTTDYNQIGD